MNKYKNIFMFLSILIINILELLKYKVFSIDFNIIIFSLKTLLLLTIFIFTNIKIKKYKFLNNYINIVLLTISIMSLLFNSFNSIGFLLLFAFLNTITIVCMKRLKTKFEISLVLSTSFIILTFVIIGVLNLLKFSYLFILLIFIVSIIYLLKNKTTSIEIIKSINKNSLIIFSILFLIAIISGVGRYVHKWDEYSYWAYAAKVTIDTSSLKSLVSYTSSMSTYPPVSSIWHYFVNLFTGYSEPNLYIGLTILDFIFLMPLFMKLSKKNITNTILLIIVGVTFPYLFNGSITYGLLYVDLLLGFMCASVLILKDYLKENNKSFKPLILILILITLLKPQGFIYSSTLIFLFFLQEVFQEKISIKTILIKLKKFIIPVAIIILIFIAWQIIARIFEDGIHSYLVSIKPDSLKTDLSQKLNSTFLLRYINSLKSSIDDSIFYSFINIPFFSFLITLFGLIYLIHIKEKKEGLIKILSPYIISYVVFFALIALSLFIMFSYYEASILASFGRYLAPINIGLITYVLYKISYLYEKNLSIKIIYLILIAFIGFSNVTFFISDIKERRDTAHIKIERENIFKEINEKTKKDSKIFVINQEDTDGIMPLWYARYYCYPRIINANSNAITWKIKTPSNEWDLQDWGLTEITFQNHLIDEDFDYVFLYSKTDELFEELKNTFEFKENLKDYNLFKVNKSNNEIKLVPVK